jgi:hypothetical protein
MKSLRSGVGSVPSSSIAMASPCVAEDQQAAEMINLKIMADLYQ